MLARSILKYLLAPAVLFCAIYLLSLFNILQFSFRESIPGSLEVGAFTVQNYVEVQQPFYMQVFGRTLFLCAVTGILTLLIGYPIAYFIVRAQSRFLKSLLFFICLVPLFLGDVPRSYAWTLMLGNSGLINGTLMALGAISRPIQMMFTMGGVIAALVHITLPFMVVMLTVGISSIEINLEKAATSLGATPMQVFFTVTLPLSLPGIVAGTITCFALNFSSYATPAMVGGGRVNMVANLVHQMGINSFNFPFAAAISVSALVFIFLLVGLASRYGNQLIRTKG